MTNLQIALTILTIALVTLFTRSIAFALFPANRPVPPYVTYLGKVLPYAVMYRPACRAGDEVGGVSKLSAGASPFFLRTLQWGQTRG